MSKLSSNDDLRIDGLRPLLPPAILMEELPTDEAMDICVADARKGVAKIIHGEDKRLLVVVGPCSIHDPEAGLEYAQKLKTVAVDLKDELLIVMRTYFEKPRTTVGWKGLINDPDLNDSFNINQGLRTARGFLREVLKLGLPCGAEFLDPITPQFIADLVSWGAIGARTVESQVHRELASGLSMPVGFKNGTGGAVQVAVDAVRSSVNPHHFLSVTKQGLAAIVATRGNANCHVILRGGGGRSNADQESIGGAIEKLKAHGLPPRLMVDCSHANSSKDYLKQPEVAKDLARQISEGSESIFGIMLESFLVDGRQNVVDGQAQTYGQSITDGCMSFERTVGVLETLAAASSKRA